MTFLFSKKYFIKSLDEIPQNWNVRALNSFATSRFCPFWSFLAPSTYIVKEYGLMMPDSGLPLTYWIEHKCYAFSGFQIFISFQSKCVSLRSLWLIQSCGFNCLNNALAWHPLLIFQVWFFFLFQKSSSIIPAFTNSFQLAGLSSQFQFLKALAPHLCLHSYQVAFCIWGDPVIHAWLSFENSEYKTKTWLVGKLHV